ncbi:hypothetical protein KC349_g114 [Hortaea werneckii]|nr:hypothetical protein KC349_g114 [Hortaea werneckii]
MEIAANEEGEERREEKAYDGISDSHSSLSNDQQGSRHCLRTCHNHSRRMNHNRNQKIRPPHHLQHPELISLGTAIRREVIVQILRKNRRLSSTSRPFGHRLCHFHSPYFFGFAVSGAAIEAGFAIVLLRWQHHPFVTLRSRRRSR